MKNDIENFFDEDIPHEVLHDDSWTSSLLPDLDRPLTQSYSFEDMIEDSDYE
jgi:hypothetical protein